jgi:hypothetical protein
VFPSSSRRPVRWGWQPHLQLLSRFSGQCGLLNISQTYRPPRAVTKIAVLFYFIWQCRRLDSLVVIATGYELDDLGSVVRVPTVSRDVSTWSIPALSTGVRRQKREVHHSPLSSAEVKKMWIYTSILHTSLWHSAWLVKYRGNFTLYNIKCYFECSRNMISVKACSGYHLFWRVFYPCLIFQSWKWKRHVPPKH